MSASRERLRETIGKCILEAFSVVAEGTLESDADRKHLQNLALSSISFPNKNPQSLEGKPHDIEIRFALSSFHWLRRIKGSETLELVSDMGLVRRIKSPKELAELVLLPLEASCRREGVAHDVQLQLSGLICIVTKERSTLLRHGGKLPCPHCIKWCLGEKGLWWHQQQHHKIEHSVAAEVASNSIDTYAIIPYNPTTGPAAPFHATSLSVSTTTSSSPEESSFIRPIIDLAKEGNLAALKIEIERNNYDPANDMDPKGASPILWAAGGGHLEMVQYLAERCGCDPNQAQRGKRSFSGRTPLHWAARNGHISVVRYLVEECPVDLEAATIDGTTCFGWASWQGHLEIMEFLWKTGVNIHATNSFGCNAVLWAAQGNGNEQVMQWLQEKGCEMARVNNNGHGVFHKSAQRGHAPLCRWFFDNYIHHSLAACSKMALVLIAPDAEGYCASDLAGMGGYHDLARTLAVMELSVAARWKDAPDLPAWLTDDDSYRQGIRMRLVDANVVYEWEKFGGVRRMRSRLV